MKLMVIDGNSILNRAYYGIRPLTTRDGLYTHAIFGFLTTLLRLEGEEAPDALCVTFDVHAPTFRHQASEAYKATRKPMPEELRVQVPVLKEVLDALNIPRYEQEGWEADDLIGTISRCRHGVYSSYHDAEYSPHHRQSCRSVCRQVLSCRFRCLLQFQSKLYSSYRS